MGVQIMENDIPIVERMYYTESMDIEFNPAATRCEQGRYKECHQRKLWRE
jgi:hypothetical protein